MSLEHQVEQLTQAYLTGVIALEEYGRRRNELGERGEALDSQQRQLEMLEERQSEMAMLKATR